MATAVYKKRLAALIAEHKKVLNIKNKPVLPGNGIYERFAHPIITREHVPLSWRYDLDPKTNPLLIERLPINCAFNAGAIEHEGKIVLVVRTEGYDRKSFFALAESKSGIDGFTYRDEPLLLGQVSEPDTNVYDMRLTRHEDGWIYGLFCSERKDTSTNDLSAATAQCGIVRTKDLKKWERLPDLVTDSAQQRNVVLHPEFVNGQYALYTRPQDSFIEAGKGGGIGWGLCDSMEKAVCKKQEVIEPRIYHTIKESKNGQGPAPIKTDKGWLHIAHAVRNTAAGLRYVLYAFMSDLKEPWKVTYRPGGMLIGPMGAERLGDVSNVVFSNGAVARKNGEVLIYYASSDTRMHVARTSIARLVDYCMNTPADPLFSHKCVEQRIDLIRKNKAFLKKNPIKGVD